MDSFGFREAMQLYPAFEDEVRRRLASAVRPDTAPDRAFPVGQRRADGISTHNRM